VNLRETPTDPPSTATTPASLQAVTPRRVPLPIGRRLAIPGLISGALLLAACGGSDGGAAPAATATPTTSSAATGATDPDPDGSATGGDTPDAGVGTSDPSPESPGTPDPTLPGEPTAVPPVLDFSAPLVGGGQIEVASLAGTPVLFWFWAPF
jgi:hypothetical protein